MMNLTTLPLSFWDYDLESAARILNMVPTKKVDKTPYELCGRAGELEEIQNKDTSPSENTSEIPMEVEGFKPPHEKEVPILVEKHRQSPSLSASTQHLNPCVKHHNRPQNLRFLQVKPELVQCITSALLTEKRFLPFHPSQI
ncbi:hypothetical protein Tco_0053958 [Tanacetum coccineum]